MRILVTGAAGFIGSNYVRRVLATDRRAVITAFDSLSYAGNLENLAGLNQQYKSRYVFVRGDIASPGAVASVFKNARPDAVINFAAETHVDRSLVDAAPFIKTNIVGVQNLLDACRKRQTRRFLQVSTDEVYGSIPGKGLFTEESPIRPNNPYAATKAAGDFLVRAAHESHGLDAVITRCSNNYGPYQFPEKLIPLMLANALEDKPLPVYGDGLHVRDWIYVADHCDALHLVLKKGTAGRVYNIGGHRDTPNIEVVRMILKAVGKPESLIKYIADRPGHDRRYAMDSSRIELELGWRRAHTFERGLKETVTWYLLNLKWLEHVRSGAYRSYYRRMYQGRLQAAAGK